MPPGTKLEARCDRDLVKLYKAGALVKVHPRKPKGGRSTDADDYPPERTAYAMRSPDGLVRQAVALGHTGQFAERLLDAPFPWSKLRQGQRLLRLAERYTPERLEAACAQQHLASGLVDVPVPRPVSFRQEILVTDECAYRLYEFGKSILLLG